MEFQICRKYIYIVSVLTIGTIFQEVESNTITFASTPPDPIYGIKGGEVYFNWTYVPGDSQFLFKRWFRSNELNQAQGLAIATHSPGEAPIVKNPSYVGRVVASDTSGELTIRNLNVSDQGYVAFAVTFRVGTSLTQKVYLNITILPEVLAPLPNETVAIEGQPATLQCRIEARPAPLIKWYKDGVLLTGPDYVVTSVTVPSGNGDTDIVTSTLNITSAKASDNGKIKCEAEIPTNTVGSETKIFVYFTPRNTTLTSDRPNHVGALGHPITITCSAEGVPDIYYGIYRDGNLISNSTNLTFTIPSLALSDEGQYSCIPKNILGAGPTKDFNLTVHVAPTLKSYSPTTPPVSLSSNVTLSCTFYGEPKPNITWERINGTISTSAVTSFGTLSHNQSFAVVQSNLSFPAIQKSDHGSYKCKSSNDAGTAEQVIALDVQYPASINTTLKQNDTLVEDTSRNASWTMTAEGNPLVSIQWYLNGKPISGMSGFLIHDRVILNTSTKTLTESTLVMVGITREKAGFLVVNATNADATITTTSTIVIEYPPASATHFPVSANVTLNGSIILSCIVNSQPVAAITWTKDDSPITHPRYQAESHVIGSSLFKSTIQSNLTISQVQKGDYGIYACTAVNVHGNESRNGTLNVEYAPEFTTSLLAKHGKVENSTNFAMECKFEANPVVEVTWYKNNSVVSSGSHLSITTTVNKTASHSIITSILSFQRVSRDDYGNYVCKASNKIGTINSTTLLVVNYKPFFTNQPLTPVITNVSSTVKLSCDIQSNPVAEPSWIVDSQSKVSSSNRLSNTTSVSFSSERYSVFTTELTLTNVKRTDFGIYKCKAENTVGQDSRNITVIVHYAPVNTTTLDAEYIRTESTGRFTFGCNVLSNPIPTITWFVNGSVANSSLYSIFENITSQGLDHVRKQSNFTVNSVTRDSQASYTCKAANTLGEIQQTTTLIVHYPPTFRSLLQTPRIVNTTANVSIVCEVDSNPQSNLSWFKDGSRLSNTSKIKIINISVHKGRFYSVDSSILSIHNVDKSDSGNYSCEAINRVKTNHQTTTVLVQYAPEITENFPSEQNITETTSTYFLECIVEANPSPNIEWHKNGSIFTTGNISSLVIYAKDSGTRIRSRLIFNHGIRRNDYGTYSCNASNALGKASKHVMVNMHYGPDFLSNLTGLYNLTKSDNVSFTCSAEGNPAPSLSWYKDNNKIDSGFIMVTKVSSSTRSVVESVLKLSDIQKNDTASYRCKASNVVATKSQLVSLNVKFSPVILVSSANYTLEWKEKRYLSCKTDANPPITRYEWRKNGILDTSVTSSSYEIKEAGKNDRGTYTCSPFNLLGSGGTVTYVLQVKDEPEGITASCVLGSTSVSCQCNATGYPAPVFYWTVFGSSVIKANGTSLSLAKIGKNTATYVCHVKNGVGAGKTKEVILLISQKQYGDWGDWGQCDTDCGIGYEFRERDCNVKPCHESLRQNRTCNATACPPVYTNWTDWSACNESCGAGYQFRSRNCTNERPCPQSIQIQSQSCTGTQCSPAYTDWADWSACNVSCGAGYQTRTRECKTLANCAQSKQREYQACNGTVCGEKDPVKAPATKDETWAIVLYVLLPILLILLILLILWLARANRRKSDEEPIIIPINRNLSAPPSIRSMPTKREIYLPSNNFGVLNSAYRLDSEMKDMNGNVNEEVDGKEYESVEVEMAFEDPDPSESTTDNVDNKSSPESTTSPPGSSRYMQLPEDKQHEVDTWLGSESQPKKPLAFENEAFTQL